MYKPIKGNNVYKYSLSVFLKIVNIRLTVLFIVYLLTLNVLYVKLININKVNQIRKNIMQEKDLKLLFDAGALMKCVISRDAIGVGFNAHFIRRGEKTTSLTLDVRPRLSGDPVEFRVFKTIDSACSLVKRKIGFNEFLVKQT